MFFKKSSYPNFMNNNNSIFVRQSLNLEKKKNLKDEKLEREYPEVWSDFSLEVVDKTLVSMFEGL